MPCERTIRRMTPEETLAKRDWGTSACQVRGCYARALYLIRERWTGPESGAGESWQYCCQKHARAFVRRHQLAIPGEPEPATTAD